MRRLGVLVGLVILSAALWWMYSRYRLPAGIQEKGLAADIKEWVSLIAAIVSTIAAIITLVTQLRKEAK